MKTKSTLTPQDLSRTFESLTRLQKLQIEAIITMMSSLLASVYYTSKTENEIPSKIDCIIYPKEVKE